MKRKSEDREELDELLERIPYPGDSEQEIRKLTAGTDLADRVMQVVYAREAAGTLESSRLSSRFRIWAAAAALNVLLILLFGGRPMLLISAVGPAGFYSQLLFLALGAATSVSVIGCVLSLSPGQIGQIARLLPSGYSR